MSSESSGITDIQISPFHPYQHQHQVSSLQSFGKESMSSEWTDEKHSMYLKSMEASFVEQLYSSLAMRGSHSHTLHNSCMRSFKHSESCTCDQFKVHRNGSWQSIKFRKGEPPPEGVEESHFLQGNPWIRHYRACGGQDQITQGCNSHATHKVSSRGRKKLTCGSTNIITHTPVHQTHQDSTVGEEFSDQNFDEEQETSKLHKVKRARTVESCAGKNQVKFRTGI